MEKKEGEKKGGKREKEMSLDGSNMTRALSVSAIKEEGEAGGEEEAEVKERKHRESEAFKEAAARKVGKKREKKTTRLVPPTHPRRDQNNPPTHPPTHPGLNHRQRGEQNRRAQHRHLQSLHGRNGWGRGRDWRPLSHCHRPGKHPPTHPPTHSSMPTWKE